MTVGGREFYVYRYEGKFNDIPNAAVILSYPKEAFGNPRYVQQAVADGTIFCQSKGKLALDKYQIFMLL